MLRIIFATTTRFALALTGFLLIRSAQRHIQPSADGLVFLIRGSFVPSTLDESKVEHSVCARFKQVKYIYQCAVKVRGQ